MSHVRVQDYISRDAAEAFEAIWTATRSGRIRGGAYALDLGNGLVIVNCCGTLAEDPILARGCVATLDDELAELVAAMKQEPSPQDAPP